MSMMKDELPDTFPSSPAALRPELEARFLSAMREASAEECGDELERRLRRLRPAPVTAARERAWLQKMQAGVRRRLPIIGSWGRLYRWSAAAALFVLCTSGSILMMNSSAMATVPAGLACRSLMESRTGDSVEWHEGQVALRSCDVLYEDSFILDGEEDSTITVRVPVRTQVLVEEEVI